LIALPQWTQAVHHDGSALYLSNPLPKLNETVTVGVRVPIKAPIRAIYLRTAPDGEQHFEEMARSGNDEISQWYSVPLTMRNRRMAYRFKLMTDLGALYLTGLGIHRADLLDHYDFKLIADFESPDWLRDSVFYQIFPDRFYNGDPSLTPTAGETFDHPPYGSFTTKVRDWDAPPLPFDEGGTVDFYGGDLPGIVQKIEYLQDLGVNALYLNPIFTSPTNHKYNTSDFFSVDPTFGGNDSLVMLRKALDVANMRYVLDLTPNHCGSGNTWFREAQADPNAPVAEYFTFYNHPDEYEAWMAVRVLPKLNYTSQRLRHAMYRDPKSVMRYWLQAPFRADGWRLDVWNMTARNGTVDVQDEVGREMRVAVKETNPDAYLFGEHFFDGTDSLQGDQLDATMNYQGFSFPVWRWLSGHDLGAWSKTVQGYADDVPMPAEAMATQMTHYMAAVPWVIARNQFNQLGSHDTPRILHVVNEDHNLAMVAATLLLTFPGVPCIYYGDEIGMTGGREPASRGGMIWDEDRQDKTLKAHYKQLIQLRRTAHALCHGGFQWLLAEGDTLAYLRASRQQQLIVLAHRGPSEPITLQVPAWTAGIMDGTSFSDVFSGGEFTVTDGLLTITLSAREALILETR
jgi:alpha-glucosidase